MSSRWPGSCGAVLAAPLAAWGAWWRRRRRRREKQPFELALDESEEARSLMRPRQARAFSMAVSETVRRYIEERFVVQAHRAATWEFLQDLAARTNSPLAGHRLLLGEFLYHCDLAKFGLWLLSVPEMEAMLQSARRFVRETARQPETARGSPNPKE